MAKKKNIEEATDACVLAELARSLGVNEGATLDELNREFQEKFVLTYPEALEPLREILHGMTLKNQANFGMVKLLIPGDNGNGTKRKSKKKKS